MDGSRLQVMRYWVERFGLCCSLLSLGFIEEQSFLDKAGAEES